MAATPVALMRTFVGDPLVDLAVVVLPLVLHRLLQEQLPLVGVQVSARRVPVGDRLPPLYDMVLEPLFAGTRLPPRTALVAEFRAAETGWWVGMSVRIWGGGGAGVGMVAY